MSKQPPPAPTASAIGPCPTIIQIVGRPGTGSLPRTIAPPDHPLLEIKYACKHYMYIYTDGSKQDEKVACAVISPNFMDSIRLPDNILSNNTNLTVVNL